MGSPWDQQIGEAADFLRKESGGSPAMMVILSGGLEAVVGALRNCREVDAAQVPHFPRSTAEGHSGKLIFGEFAGRELVVALGRSHFYEGLSMQDITVPLHALRECGVRQLVITNAAGGVNPSFAPGDLMLIRDHINCMGENPLRGIANLSKHQFVDLTNAYTASLRDMVHEVATAQQLELQEGVYLATSGPSYETPAEIRAFRHIGADAVGMSTIPEVIVANFYKMPVVGISCIANMAADLHPGGMNHGEVLRAVKGAEPRLVKLLLGIFERLAGASNQVSAV
jgi:purine-nucleoside phosphorylase